MALLGVHTCNDMFIAGIIAFLDIAGRTYAKRIPFWWIGPGGSGRLRSRREYGEERVHTTAYGRVCGTERGRVDVGTCAGDGRRNEGFLRTRLAITAWLE